MFEALGINPMEKEKLMMQETIEKTMPCVRKSRRDLIPSGRMVFG